MKFGQTVEPFITVGNKTITLFQLFEKRGLEGFFHPKGTSFYNCDTFAKVTKLAAIDWCLSCMDSLYRVYDATFLKDYLNALKEKILTKSFLDEAIIHRKLWSVEYAVKADLDRSGSNRLEYTAAYHMIKACQAIFAPHQSNMLFAVHEQLMQGIACIAMFENRDSKSMESVLRVAKLKEFARHEEILVQVLNIDETCEGRFTMPVLQPYQGETANGY